jgi:hypothetical protein
MMEVTLAVLLLMMAVRTPLARVTVLPLSVSVTFAPTPFVPPPGSLAKVGEAQSNHAKVARINLVLVLVLVVVLVLETFWKIEDEDENDEEDDWKKCFTAIEGGRIVAACRARTHS